MSAAVSNISPPGLPDSMIQRAAPADERFETILARTRSGDTNETRRSAEQFVATTFIMPVLRSVRESSQAAPPFAPTQAEKQFGALLDQHIADEVVRSANLPIVGRIAETFGRGVSA